MKINVIIHRQIHLPILFFAPVRRLETFSCAELYTHFLTIPSPHLTGQGQVLGEREKGNGVVPTHFS